MLPIKGRFLLESDSLELISQLGEPLGAQLEPLLCGIGTSRVFVGLWQTPVC